MIRIHITICALSFLILASAPHFAAAQEPTPLEGVDAGAPSNEPALPTEPEPDPSAETQEPELGQEPVEGDEAYTEEEPSNEEETEPAAEPDTDESSSWSPQLPPPALTYSYVPKKAATDSDDLELLIPPVYIERRAQRKTTVVFPAYFERLEKNDHQLLIGPYFQRRAPEIRTDVLFPIYWNWHNKQDHTWIVPPAYLHLGPTSWDLGLAPLFFLSKNNASHYTVLPPLLTASWADKNNAHTFAGPFWRVRKKADVDWGIFPLLWMSDSSNSAHHILAPLYFNFEDKNESKDLTVIPPFYYQTQPNRTRWGLAPLLLHSHGARDTSWTLLPLFHYAHSKEDFTLITPLFGYHTEPKSYTLVTPLYQRHRGKTELDGVGPFFFWWRDPQEYASSYLVPPLFYHYTSPIENTTLVAPFWGYWHERGRYTTWVTPLLARHKRMDQHAGMWWFFPTLQLSYSPTSSTQNFHPLVYRNEEKKDRHLVLAPLYWDYEDYTDKSRTTIFFPFLWRFREGNDVTQVAFNVYWDSGRTRGERYFETHIFPFFSYGEPNSRDHWWNVFYGLVGYQRQGAYARMKLFWIPFQVDGP